MPIDVEYLEDGELIRITGRGAVTDDEVRGLTRDLHESEAKIRRYRRVLGDWSQVESADVSNDTIREFAAASVDASNVVSHGLAVAMVATRASVYGFVRMWELHIQSTGFRTRMFCSCDEAERWLESQSRWISRALATLSIKLQPPDIEAQFRLSVRKRDARVAMTVMSIVILFEILYMVGDLEYLAGLGERYIVLSVRAASVALSALGIVLVRRSHGVTFWDNVVFLWAALFLAGIVSVNAMMPIDDATASLAWDPLLALAVYVALPIPLMRQVIVASIFTLGDIVLFAQYRASRWPVAHIDVLAAFACAHLVGIFASWETKRWRRRLYQASRREADVRAHLEAAWTEIKTLKGIIPICSHCKKVRTDEGHWRQVEVYVRDHSDAEFSHGICPECMREHYPELADTDG